MEQTANLPYDKNDPISIFEYAKTLLNHSLREFIGDAVIAHYRPKGGGKGQLGQLVEKLVFGYKPNSSRDPDFDKAGVELKTTGLTRKKDLSLQIKERLVIDIINFVEVVNVPFEMSAFYKKCRLLLLLFYLHEEGVDEIDFIFLYTALWQIPEKDLLMIKHDYEVIVNKIKRGEAHKLSEGDTEYLGACNKGNSGSKLKKQPFSDIKAKGRAFSLKPAYMRTVLRYIEASGSNAITNYEQKVTDPQIVTTTELRNNSFEDIVLSRLLKFKGRSYHDICSAIGRNYDSAKHKYAAIASRIISEKTSNVNETEEFKKAGLQLKTIRIEANGKINESMSFENIDYNEVLQTEFWEDSRLYEIFSGRFLFVIFKANGEKIRYYSERKNAYIEENSYSLMDAFFWTMPTQDLALAEPYWQGIKQAILDNHIEREFMPKNELFHVRPKATRASDLTENPNGGMAKKYCYWFNNEYVKSIVNKNVKK